VARFKFLLLILEIPSRIEREDRCEAPTVGKERNPRETLVRGVYTPAVIIGSTDTGSVLPRVQGN
jgi:hypothetical protein